MSGRRQQPDERPEFFADRSLGRYIVPGALRNIGWSVRALFEVYGETEEEKVADERWITEATASGWVLLMKDESIRMKPAERDAILAARARAFVVTNQAINGQRLAEHYVVNQHRIVQRCRKPGPYIVGVYLEKPYLRNLLP